MEPSKMNFSWTEILSKSNKFFSPGVADVYLKQDFITGVVQFRKKFVFTLVIYQIILMVLFKQNSQDWFIFIGTRG